MATDAYTKILKPILFRLDAELAHNAALWCIARGLIRARLLQDPRLERRLFGVTFANPLGLAAGFDKDGVAVNRWRGLGFGHAEIGTVTPEPQPGNPRPRLFRLPEERAIINRLGFNSRGAASVAARLASRRAGFPIGVNIGKNRHTPDEKAADDYERAFRLLSPHADYVAVNVSSPNTPGLRGLQERGPLSEILARLIALDPAKPLFVKVAPDLDPGALHEVVEVALKLGLTGLICTNTTLDRSSLRRDPGIEGGLSGAPLRERADAALSHVAQAAGGRLTLIGVGGVFSGSDIRRKLELGADLVQVYTGWVYSGPSAAARWLTELLS